MNRLLLIATVLLGIPAPATDLSFRLVVNHSNPVTSLSREDVSDLFLKRVTRWPDDSSVLAIDQAETNAIREAFTRDVHRRSSAGVRAYWQQRIFSGRDVPPPEKEDDAEVLEFVRRHPGAIGYVSAGAATASVKVVAVR